MQCNLRYPGHIAKAERELADYLKKVDVVIEVRDCRIPYSTTHPSVPDWVAGKPLIIAMARLDQVSKQALTQWREYYSYNPAHTERPDAKVFFVDGKLGAVLTFFTFFNIFFFVFSIFFLSIHL